MHRTLFFMLAGCICADAFAFESYEHKQIGDLAFHIAKRIYCGALENDDRKTEANTEARRAACVRLKEVLFDPVEEWKNPASAGDAGYYESEYRLGDERGGKPKDKPRVHVSYGDIAMCVDFFLTPEKMISGNWRNRPERNSAIPSEAGKWGVAVHERCRDSALNVQGNAAAHINHSHFQRELMVGRRIYHGMGVSFIRDDDNLFAALLANGIADHYLGDYFAPGHVITPRDRMSDIMANAMHDKGNDGRYHLVFDKGDESFARALRSLRQPGDSSRLGLDETDRAWFFHNGKCVHSDCAGPGNSDARPETLQEIYASWVDASGDEHPNVEAFGDAMLWRKAATGQRLILLAYHVNSILEVLGALDEQPEGRQSIRSSVPKLTFEVQEKNLLDLGIYVPQRIAGNLDGTRYDIRFASGIEDGQAGNVPDGARSPPQLPVLGLSYGYASAHFGDRVGRYSVSAEAGPSDVVRYGRWNVALFGGYTSFWEAGRHGYGLHLRPTFVIAETETMIGLVASRNHHAGKGKGEWKNALGLRIDQGFSSFFTVYMKFARDDVTQLDGAVKHGSLSEFGLQLAMPLSRVERLASAFGRWFTGDK